MADLYTHVLFAFVVAVVLSWRYDWISYPFVAVAMVGATLPDLKRLELVVPSASVEAVLGVPFSWTPLHRAGGTILVVCLGALLVSREYRRGVFVLLLLGAGSHYLLDFLLYKPAGVTSPLLWPFVGRGFQVEGFYLSTDRWPAVVTTTIAGIVWYVNRTWRPWADPPAGEDS